jgi:hypothetical protein
MNCSRAGETPRHALTNWSAPTMWALRFAEISSSRGMLAMSSRRIASCASLTNLALGDAPLMILACFAILHSSMVRSPNCGGITSSVSGSVSSSTSRRRSDPNISSILVGLMRAQSITSQSMAAHSAAVDPSVSLIRLTTLAMRSTLLFLSSSSGNSSRRASSTRLATRASWDRVLVGKVHNSFKRKGSNSDYTLYFLTKIATWSRYLNKKSPRNCGESIGFSSYGCWYGHLVFSSAMWRKNPRGNPLCLSGHLGLYSTRTRSDLVILFAVQQHW